MTYKTFITQSRHNYLTYFVSLLSLLGHTYHAPISGPNLLHILLRRFFLLIFIWLTPLSLLDLPLLLYKKQCLPPLSHSLLSYIITLIIIYYHVEYLIVFYFFKHIICFPQSFHSLLREKRICYCKMCLFGTRIILN